MQSLEFQLNTWILYKCNILPAGAKSSQTSDPGVKGKRALFLVQL